MKTYILLIFFCIGLYASFIRDDHLQVVYDDLLQLTWQDDDNRTMTWDEAMAYCATLRFAGRDDWYLSDVDTLYTLVEPSSTPATLLRSVNSVFLNAPTAMYWSSTEVEGNTANAWVVEFLYNDKRWVQKSDINNVRCVRDGKIFNPNPAVLLYLLQ